jgi:hypothetical protein
VESLIEHPGAMTHASTAGSLLEVPKTSSDFLSASKTSMTWSVISSRR